MLKNRIIPCLDVKNGRVVKGINFVDLIDAGDPVEQAKIYDEQGADELCFLDITASNENRDIILDTVKKTAEKCFIPLTVGGGVRTLEDIRKAIGRSLGKMETGVTSGGGSSTTALDTLLTAFSTLSGGVPAAVSDLTHICST